MNKMATHAICLFSVITHAICLFMELYYEQEYYVRKSFVICATQLAGGSLLKQLKYFEVMLNIFEFSRV